MKILQFLFGLTFVCALAGSMCASDKTAPSAPETYQAFLIALVKGDHEVVTKLALPNPDLGLLTSSGPVPAAYQKEAISQIEASGYRVLKIGETFRLPNGRTIAFTEEMEKQGRVIVVGSRDPLPHLLQKTESGWRVEAGDLIAARKARAQQTK